MPRPLIVDLDGVLRVWDPAIMLDAERQAGLPQGSLANVALGNEALLHEAVTGQISDDQWRQQIIGQLAVSSGEEAAKHAVAQWSKARGLVNTDVLQVIRSQRDVRTIAILTNATSRLDADLVALGLDTEVDVVFNSSSLGVAKPDPRIFRLVGQALDTALSDCVLVDDTRAHAEAAALLGVTTHLYTEPSALGVFLAHDGAA